MVDQDALIQAVRERSSEQFSRSGGPGGQNVNKVNTRVTLLVPLAELPLSASELQRVQRRLATRVNRDGWLVIQVSDTRSQRQNREVAVDRATSLIADAARTPKRRRQTRPGAAARERRIARKKRRARLKEQRRRPEQQ